MPFEEKIDSLFHITHISNLNTIFEYGLLAHCNRYKKRDISNHEVNNRREAREPIYNRKIHDYVPFYFNPRNAMMYKNRYENIVILGFDKKLLLKDNALFTNKNAAASDANFFNNIKDLDKINWDLVYSKSWYDKPKPYETKQIMMAEGLIYKKVKIENLTKIYCKDKNTKNYILNTFQLKSIKVEVKPFLFFKG